MTAHLDHHHSAKHNTWIFVTASVSFRHFELTIKIDSHRLILSSIVKLLTMEHSPIKHQHEQRELMEQEDHHAQLQFLSIISAMISSFHYQVDRVCHLLNALNSSSSPSSSSPESVMTSGSHGGEIRLCCRNIKDIFSRREELEYMWTGRFCGCSSGDITVSLTNKDEGFLDRKREVQIFVDDLVRLICIENVWDDPTWTSTNGLGAGNSVHSLALVAVVTMLPRTLDECPLSLEQQSKLMRRALLLMQDIVEEYSYVNGHISSPEMLQDLKFLQPLVNLVTSKVSLDRLQRIVQAVEAMAVLKIPLQLASISGKMHSSIGQPSNTIPADLLYELRVFVDILLLNFSGIITREHERQSHSVAGLKPSIREWIRLQGSKAQSERFATSSRPGQTSATIYEKQNQDSRDREKMDCDLTESQMSLAGDRGGAPIDTDKLLSLLDGYGQDLLEDTVLKLQGPIGGEAAGLPAMMGQAGKHVEGMGWCKEGTMYAEEESRERKEGENGPQTLVTNISKMKPEQIVSAFQMAHMSADFLLYVNSEKAISTNVVLSGNLRELWISWADFVVHNFSDDCFDNLAELEGPATELLFRLTKTHVGVQLVSSETKELFRGDEELCAVTALIFRLMNSPGGEAWIGDGKDWVAFLLEKCRNETGLREVLRMSLLAVTTTFSIDRAFNDNFQSIYDSLVGLTGLEEKVQMSGQGNDVANGNSDAIKRSDEEDPWSLYMQDICFPMG